MKSPNRQSSIVNRQFSEYGWLLGSFSSGLLLVLIFPRWNLDLLCWVSLVPLLLFIPEISKWRHALLAGLVLGVVSFGGQTYWIPATMQNYGGLSPTASCGVFALMVLTLSGYAVLFVVPAWRLLRTGRILGWLAIPLLWVGVEWLRSHWILGGFPWCLLGYCLHRRLALAQVADLAGVYGVSFVIAAVNTAVARTLRQGADLRRFSAVAIVILVALGGLCLYGLRALAMAGRWAADAPALRVAIVQPNISLEGDLEYFRDKYYRQFPASVDRAAAAGAALVIFPEAPAPFYYQADSQWRQSLEDAAARNRVAIVANTTWEIESGSPGQSNYRNSAIALDAAGVLRYRYDKMHLVPFGEYVPWKDWLWFAEPLVQEVSSFAAGTEPVVMQLGNYRWGTSICFEAIFPGLIGDFAARDVHFLINLTNDGWYGDTAAPDQHLAMAVFRAIETRRYLVRAANTGYSGFISPLGEVQRKTRLMAEDLVVGDIRASSQRTFFVRTGDTAAAWALLFAIGLLVYLEFTEPRQRRTPRRTKC